MKGGHVSSMPDQLTVNQYQSGQGKILTVKNHLLYRSLGLTAVNLEKKCCDMAE